MLIAEVAFNLPLERTFHYLVPQGLERTLRPGMRVAAPFGQRERIGFVISLPRRSPIKELKVIRRVIDPIAVIGDERWALASWLSDYYCCSLGEALAAMVPSGLRLPRSAFEGGAAEQTIDVAADEASASPLALSARQREAYEAIVEELDAARPRTLLLHGVTGSGKTELYLQAIGHLLARGRSAICLIPEIALTAQTIERFHARFGRQVAVWHSRLTARQRAQTWWRAASGACRIVVGARSAVFAPVARLGLVILDEEHESTYKQEDTPRYHAREVAQARARLAKAAVLLGSATPSIEAYHTASTGRDRLLILPERVEGRPLPRVDVIDMREEFGRRRSIGPLSGRLQRALEQAIERGEQAILLLNRRGFARVVQCQACGTVVQCRRCSVPLVYHASRRELVCHYCNAHEPPAEVCGQCRKGYLTFRGAGTERIESELHRLFPIASIARMDRDTTTRRDSHRELYEAIKSRQVGLLVGTQMVAKGFDFPQVTLVGVVCADTALNLPDFRAGERTFDLLTQVAGRAGRGEQPGSVLVQTYCPNHYAIQAAKTHDYQKFYEEEILMRRRLRLPPFAHLIELTLHGGSRQRVMDAAERLAARLHHAASRRRFTLLGPAPHRVARFRRSYRMCLMLKGKAVEPMVGVLRTVLGAGRRFGGLPVTVNVDPI